MKKADLRKKKLGEVLMDAGMISDRQLEEALVLQRKTRRRLGRIFIELGYVDENSLADTLASQLKVPLVDLTASEPTGEALAKVPEELARDRFLLPLWITGGEMTVAMANPLDWGTIQDLEFSAGLRVNINIAAESEILKALDRAYGVTDDLEDIGAHIPETGDTDLASISVEGFGSDIDSLYRAAEFPPVVQTFSMLMSEALRAGASDIHLGPREKFVQVRMRIDGMLRSSIRYPRGAHEAMVARAKTLGKLDVANRTMPQEGGNRIGVAGREVNIRINTLPSLNGESVIVSIEEKTRPTIPFGKLGLPEKIRKSVSTVLHRGQGLLVLTGLKGSGRHSTLYSLLQLVESEALNMVGIGTSSGYSIDGLSEMRLNEAAGLGLPQSIAAALKHDPDIIATGNITDSTSAEAAMDAAMSGKLVISLMESPDSASAMGKLMDMGVSAHAVMSSVSGVLAQKLIKGICQGCIEPLDPSTMHSLKNMPPLESAFTGVGCKKCGGTGVKGRVAVFEFLGMEPELRKALEHGFNEYTLREEADKLGLSTIFDDAWHKAASGLVTIDEAMSLGHGVS